GRPRTPPRSPCRTRPTPGATRAGRPTGPAPRSRPGPRRTWPAPARWRRPGRPTPSTGRPFFRRTTTARRTPGSPARAFFPRPGGLPRGVLVHPVDELLEPGLGHVQDAGDGGQGDPLGQHLLHQVLLPVRDGGLPRVEDKLPAAGHAPVVLFAVRREAIPRHVVRQAGGAADHGTVLAGAPLPYDSLTFGALPTLDGRPRRSDLDVEQSGVDSVDSLGAARRGARYPGPRRTLLEVAGA